MKKVRIGLVGSGFAAELHMQGYQKVYGVNVEVMAVCSLNKDVCEFAKKHRIPTIYRDYRDILSDRDVDVIDICTPTVFHAQMVLEAVEAGKHVICEKPFMGYFGQTGDAKPIGHRVSKVLMYERILEDMEETKRRIHASGCLFMYAENWVYAPSITKTAEIIRQTQDKALFTKAEISISGSHAPYAAHWELSGGGALIRLGCHPLTAILYLKQVEAKARGESIHIASILCDVGNLAKNLINEERKFIQSNPVDVEDWAMMNITFTDDTKATIFASDITLGGARNLVEVYTNGGVLHTHMLPNNHMVSYLTEEHKLSQVHITEKVDRKTGWQFVSIGEEWTRGYLQEIQDFMECASSGREPLANLDLAVDTVKFTYAAYWSAEEGRSIVF